METEFYVLNFAFDTYVLMLQKLQPDIIDEFFHFYHKNGHIFKIFERNMAWDELLFRSTENKFMQHKY